MSDVAPVPYQMPIVSQNGLVTLAWIAWLRQLFIRVGGNDAELMINPMTQIGDLIYGGTAGAATRLAPDTSNIRKFLRELSVTGIATPPVWDTIHAGDLPTGNLTEATSAVLTITGGTNATIGSVTIQVKAANTSQSGYLSSADWGSFNAKQSALTLGNLTTASTHFSFSGNIGAVVGSGASLTVTEGNLTEATSSVLTITGGTSAVLGSGTTIQVKASNTSQSGYLSSSDWGVFNAKESTITKGNLTEATSSVLTISGGTNCVIGSGTTIQVKAANSAQSGYLSSTDWTTFNNKLSSTSVPTIQKFTSGSGTYTTPTSPGPLYIRVRMVGGGGGGSGSQTSGAGNGGNGNDSTFGTTLLVASGGSGGTAGSNSGGSGGGASLGTGPIGTAFSGSDGTGKIYNNSIALYLCGGDGGSNPFGGAGKGVNASTGGAAKSNTGGGGAGGGLAGTATGSDTGTGGGAGGYIDAIITSPAASYSYGVGSGGSGGSAGTGAAYSAGGAGAGGIIIVEEFFQ